MGSHFDDDLTSPVEGAREAAAAEGPASPAVGRDEWVARHGERRLRRGGPLGTLEERLRRVPWWAWLTLFVVLFALLPVGVTDAYWRRVAFDTVLFMMLALGLNVVVGWGGLLDLGYLMFYGFGAFTYANLRSDQFDLHLPTLLVIAIAVVGGALLGILVGLGARMMGTEPHVVNHFRVRRAEKANPFLNDGVDIEFRDIDRRLGGKIGPVPTAGIIMLVLFAGFAFVAQRTTYGRSVFAVGGNARAAMLSGIDVARVRVVLFATSGLMAALLGKKVAVPELLLESYPDLKRIAKPGGQGRLF